MSLFVSKTQRQTFAFLLDLKKKSRIIPDEKSFALGESANVESGSSCIKMIELLMITGITFQNFRLSKYFSLTENIRKLGLFDYFPAIIVREAEF